MGYSSTLEAYEPGSEPSSAPLVRVSHTVALVVASTASPTSTVPEATDTGILAPGQGAWGSAVLREAALSGARIVLVCPKRVGLADIDRHLGLSDAREELRGRRGQGDEVGVADVAAAAMLGEAFSRRVEYSGVATELGTARGREGEGEEDGVGEVAQCVGLQVGVPDTVLPGLSKSMIGALAATKGAGVIKHTGESSWEADCLRRLQSLSTRVRAHVRQEREYE